MAAAPAYDIVAQALGGTMSVTGPAGRRADAMRRIDWRSRGRAIRRRRDSRGATDARLSGSGQHLDIAMLDCQVAWLEDALARYSATGRGTGADWLAPSVDHALSAVSRRRRIFRRGMRQRGHLAALLRCDRNERPEDRRAICNQRGPHRESRRTRTDPDEAISPLRHAPNGSSGWKPPMFLARRSLPSAEVAQQSASQGARDDPARGSSLPSTG